ncbi:MAG TPA: family 10 glycosylhydrolase [Gemmatimonadaceae bacterium]|nr:family 10 glycosylhydrolase [Gemmatimonadaceae bacterium]
MVHCVSSLALIRRAAGLLLVATAIVPAGVRVVRAQTGIPQGAPRDMSRVVIRDTTIFPPLVQREFRGVWISPAGEGDWPSRPGLPAAVQQQQLITLLDKARAIGLNAIIFHVRLSGDALYDTALAPWSAKLSGRQGVSPGYDPLAVVVREAHARGLQVHAWFNPFRASLDGGIRAAKNHVTRQHPSWVRRYGSQQWIDPGIPEARQFVIKTILDVVQRYDIDGVHLDDFFYPYRETRTTYRRVGRGRHRHTVKVTRELDFPDAASWAKYGRRAHWTDRAAWRRHNIDDFVHALYDSVHAEKPWLAVGISPFGIWRPGSPAGVDGLDSYREIYADTRKWLREGWVDYLAPQLYWPIDGAQNRFRALDAWWRSQNPLGRHVWPGLYTAGAVGPSPWALDEIPRQIATLRFVREGTMEANGHIHFRIGSLIANAGPGSGTLGDRLEAESYRQPALVPEMPWLPGQAPTLPLAQIADRGDDDGPVLRFAPGDTTSVALWVVQVRDDHGHWSTSVLPASTRKIALSDGTTTPDAVSVTAIDRVGRASPRAVLRLK